ncbi:MAG: hypothetical protein BMS9Abin36_1092 [Gammaproteobacteria bacterium]|nr:MAG: hypothetical protein BMS9Abin36_1092 [Gammaproteobacteria bacterium]
MNKGSLTIGGIAKPANVGVEHCVPIMLKMIRAVCSEDMKKDAAVKSAIVAIC